MKTFDYSKLNCTIDNEILGYIAKIHEYKGKQQLYTKQKKDKLEKLVEIAKIQSIESSNKIEGIISTNTRIKQLVQDKTTPRNRDEKEIMGYRDVLNIIHENFEYIPITPSYILQLHKYLYQYSNPDFGGKFKNTQNYILEGAYKDHKVTEINIAPNLYHSQSKDLYAHIGASMISIGCLTDFVKPKKKMTLNALGV